MTQSIKKKNFKSKDDMSLLKEEAKILKSLDHKNIVKFKHVCLQYLLKIRDVGGRVFLGMELLQGGRLSDLIRTRKLAGDSFSYSEQTQIMSSILEAIEYI